MRPIPLPSLPAIVCIVLLHTVVVATSQAQGPGRCGEPTIDQRDDNFVVIDANTGSILEGSTRFRKGERVQIIIRNRNPYRFAYRTNMVIAPLESKLLADFIGPLGVAERTRPDVTGSPNMPQMPLGSDCNSRDAMQQQRLQELIERKATALRELAASQRNALEDDIRQYDRFLASTSSAAFDCERAQQDADHLLPVLDRMIRLKDAARLQSDLRTGITDLAQLYDRLETLYPETAADCRAAIREGRTSVVQGLNDSASAIGTIVDRLSSQREAFEDLTRIIYAAQAPGAFTEVLYPYAADDATRIEVELYRRDLRDKNASEARIGRVELQLGENRFVSLSAGFGFSTIGNTEYKRQIGLVPMLDTNGIRIGDTVGTTFGIERSTDQRVAVMMMLNFHLVHWEAPAFNGVSFALSLGYPVGTDLFNSERSEYVIGGTFGFANDNALLSIGLHSAPVPELAGGFQVGDVVPSTVADPLPLEYHRRLGFVVVASGRLR